MAETYTKADLVADVATKKDISKAEAARIVDLVIDLIKNELGDGNDVKISGLFTAKVSTSEARKGVHPRTREEIDIPAKKRVKFTPAAVIKRTVAGE